MKNKIIKYLFIFWLLCFGITVKAQIQKSYSDSMGIVHYDINLNMTKMGAKHIEGFAVLTLVPKVTQVHYIALDLLALSVDSVKMNNDILNHQQTGEKLRVDFLTPLNTGDTAELTVFYRGTPVMDNSGWGGFYFGSDSVSAFNLGVGFDAIPHNYGRVWYPCIDDFVDRATYDCRITVNNGSMAVCGGQLVGVIDNGNGTNTFHWHLSTPIPTYLSSVAVGIYAVVSDTYQGIEKDIPIEIYVRPQDTAKVAGTFVNLKAALQTFEEHFGPYRWQRVGYVGVFFNSGAMEHATSIAYPNACIYGGTAYDDLMSHELSHHWFGNLITCSTAEDMWINEGWASFCEFIFFENVYSLGYAKDFVRTIHKQVLQMAHIVDGAYWPLYGIPPELTYCRTVYDKGSLVANNLRAYLGDSLFFNGVKAFLDTFQFKDVNSYQLRDFLSNYTQIDLTDFFDNWVFTGGFPHFSVDSFLVADMGNGTFKTDVFMKQKMNGRTTYANSNVVELTFANNNWHFETDTIMVSGVQAQKSFYLDFNPKHIFVNFDEKSCFAATSFTKVINQTGTVSFPETHFTTNISQVSDSVLLRITHNWVPADTLKINNPHIVRISDYRYWNVEGINISTLKANGRFHYNRSMPLATSLNSNGWLDNTLYSGLADSLILLHRINAADDWKVQSFSRIGNHTTGFIIADTLKEGEYVLAIGTPYNASLNENKTPYFDLNIVPNPSGEAFNILYPHNFEGLLQISDINGKILENTHIAIGTTAYKWTPSNDLPSGIYMVTLSDKSQTKLSKKMVYQK